MIPIKLCKSILFENIAYDDSKPVFQCEGDKLFNCNARYYLVVVQYVSKFNAEKLKKFVFELPSLDKRLSKKKFNFRLAQESGSDRLTGFGKNGVCPFGMATDIQIILDKKCLTVSPPVMFMGGGDVDLKLSVPVSDFIRSTNCKVADISEERLVF